MARVTLEGVEKIWPDGNKAVRNLDLEIDDGEFVVLVGPSGCGKSTTLRMIAGLEVATAGTIRIGDRVVNDVVPKDRDIAMVFQGYALYPHMTVSENIAFPLTMRKVPRAEIASRVGRVAEVLGLADQLGKRPKELSGGQRQRVALGRAIVREPQVFLFDEPLSNLDAKLRVETRAELKRLHAELGTTTIYVTHDQEEAMTLGDRVAVMSAGVVRQFDSPLAVYRRPRDRFVASFLGMPAMNLLEGEVGDDGAFDATCLRVPLASSHRGRAVLGVRPEDVVLADASAAPRANVDIVEVLGNQMDVVLELEGGARLVARVPSRELSRGDVVGVAIEAKRVHLFDAAGEGLRLS